MKRNISKQGLAGRPGLPGFFKDQSVYEGWHYCPFFKPLVKGSSLRAGSQELNTSATGSFTNVYKVNPSRIPFIIGDIWNRAKIGHFGPLYQRITEKLSKGAE